MGNMGGGTGDGFLGDSNGVLGGAANIGADGELFVPPLESISTEQESFKSERIYTNNSNYFNNTNPIMGYNNNDNNSNPNNNVKAENLAGVVESCFQDQELMMGDWDLEDWMKDVSSLPFLDFQ